MSLIHFEHIADQPQGHFQLCRRCGEVLPLVSTAHVEPGRHVYLNLSFDQLAGVPVLTVWMGRPKSRFIVPCYDVHGARPLRLQQMSWNLDAVFTVPMSS